MYDVQEIQFLSGGYYLARPSKRGPDMSATLIPERILSASSCICDLFPDSWVIRWSSDDRHERERSAATFAISPGEIDTIINWGTSSFQKVFGWPSTFYSLETAQAARVDFLSKNIDVVIFGLGLHCDDKVRFLQAAAPEEQKPGCSPMGETGIYECVKAQRALAPGGQHVGFELLAMLYGQLSCSWLCNGLEILCAEQLGVKPNEHGFIGEYADARRCAEYVSRDEVGAEPGLWLPWLVTLYSGIDPFRSDSRTV